MTRLCAGISASQLSGISQERTRAPAARRVRAAVSMFFCVVGLDLVPPERAAEADARRLLRRIGRGVAVGGADQGEIVGLAGEEAQRVEAPAHRVLMPVMSAQP